MKDIYGVAKPEHKGSFIGQTITTRRKERTGQVIMLTAANGDKFPHHVKRNVDILHWTWDGKDWMLDAQFTKGFVGHGKPLVSKNDFDAFGNPLPPRRK